MKAILARLVSGAHLTADEAEEAVRTIMAGDATPAQVGAFLTGLRRNGETVEEIVGCARAMRLFVDPVQTSHSLVVDTCGTGGDGRGTFNISTTAAFVVAGAGVPVAKHGNRAASSRSGSADVLEALGIAIDLDPAEVGRCLDAVGIAFLFAQKHHPAMRYAAGPRRELGFRTVFNLLGPLTNPAGAQVQVVGVGSPEFVVPLAEALRQLGSRRALIVHGSDGVDEFTLSGPSRVADSSRSGPDGGPLVYEVTPEEAGLRRAPLEALSGGSPEDNAVITEAVLRGEDTGPRRDVVCLNAAAALLASGRVRDLRAGVLLSVEVIASGGAWEKLCALREFTTASATRGA